MLQNSDTYIDLEKYKGSIINNECKKDYLQCLSDFVNLFIPILMIFGLICLIIFLIIKYYE